MGKLLALISLGQDLYSKWLLRRLVVNAIVLAGLVIIVAMMTGALLIIGVYAAFHALLMAGLPIGNAILVTSGLVVGIIFLMILLAMQCISNMRTMPHNSMLHKKSLGSHAAEVIDGFLSGLLNDSPKV